MFVNCLPMSYNALPLANATAALARMFFSGKLSAIEGSFQEAPSFSIYPNPASEQIRIVGLNQRPEQVDLIAADGRLVSRLSTANWPTVSIADVPAGMYYLSLQTAEVRRSLPLIVHE